MAAIDATEKTCKACNKTLPTSKFYIQKQRGDNGEVWEYYDSQCKECRKAYSYSRRQQRKLAIISYMGGYCKDCGYDDLSHTEVFDVHHLDPSSKEISIGRCNKSLETLKPELDKCILLCANCHRIRHATED